MKNAPIYIFDDSFSALDMKTDARLREALHQAASGSTLLIVAQRVGTILNADQIIVLENGEIVGRGIPASCCEPVMSTAKLPSRSFRRKSLFRPTNFSDARQGTHAKR
ncbi:MAG: hypothetical protein R3A44_23515 [Caldilineaceae bacterium]